MFCQKCGAQIADNATVCPKCGEPREGEIVAKEKARKEKTVMIISGLILIVIIAVAVNGGKKLGVKDISSVSSTQTSANSSYSSASASGKAETGVVGKYTVALKGFTLSKDYQGKPAVVITYNWTNNGDKAESAAVALHCHVFQNKVECDTAVVMDDKAYNAENIMKDIQPGASLDVQQAYVLQDSANPIDVEISELISFSDAQVTQTYNIVK